jgi:DNA invertase Pin-like site-specific DNA recombinase
VIHVAPINKNLPDMYAMYLRKSRKDLELEALGEGETLARHHARLMTLAARYDIHPDQIVVYRETVSGDSIDARPEMLRLLADVYAKKYKGVLVTEVERLARGNTKDQGEVADAFQATSTLIITESKVYDPNNESDQNYFEFGLFMSRQ